MAITSPSDYIASAKQNLIWAKTGTRTTVAQSWFSVIDVAGQPGAGTLAGSNTANGVVPTDATAGYPAINTFAGGALGYLTRVAFGSSVAGRMAVFDRLFLAGAYSFNANTNLTTQPSYSGRLPGTDYKNLEIWAEQVTAATGNQAVSVGYTNEGGTASRSTGAVGVGAAQTVGRCWQLPLQAGDSGIQKVDNVTGSVGSAGTFNVMVLRRLWEGRVIFAGFGDIHDLYKVGMPQVYDASALTVMLCPDSTAIGLPDLILEVASL